MVIQEAGFLSEDSCYLHCSLLEATPCIRKKNINSQVDLKVIRLTGNKAKGNSSIELAQTVAKKRVTIIIVMLAIVVSMHQTIEVVVKD